MNKIRDHIDYKNPALRPITGEIIDTSWEIFAEHGIETLYSHDISVEDATYIHNKLVEAEHLAHEQGKESPLKRVKIEEIIDRAHNGHILLKNKADHNRIVGCIFLYKYNKRYQWAETYERVTLWKDSAFWNQYSKLHSNDKEKSLPMWKYLMWKMTREVGNQPLLSVTDNTVVVNNNKEMWYTILLRKHLPLHIRNLLSEYKKLWDRNYADKFFCFNTLFYELVSQEFKERYGDEKFIKMEKFKDIEVEKALKEAELKAKEEAEMLISHTQHESQEQLSQVL